jgi:hypothetical protein
MAGWRGADAGGALDPGATVCGLVRCERSCGSALGGQPHGIRRDFMWPRTRVATRAHPRTPPGFGAAHKVHDEKPKGAAARS